MAITRIQTKKQNAGNYSNTNVVAMTSSVTAGSLLVLSLTAGSADTISSIVDTRGNTWTMSGGAASADRVTWLYYVKNAVAGATTVNITFTSGQFPDSIAIIREYGGIETTSPFDRVANGHSSVNYVNTISTGNSFDTTQADELVVIVGGASANAPTWAAGTGYGNLDEQAGFDLYTSGVLADKIVSVIGSQAGTFNTSSFVRQEIVLATFKIAAGGSAFTKSVAETVATSEVIARLKSALIKDSGTFSDTIAKLAGNPRSDSSAIVDVLIRTQSRIEASPIALSESLLLGKIKAFFETITSVEGFSPIFSFFRSLVDSPSISDNVIRQRYKTITDSFKLLELISPILSAFRTLAEGIPVTDRIVRSITRIMTDFRSFSDTLVKSLGRVWSDAVYLVDSVLKGSGYSKMVSDSLTLSDLTSRLVGKMRPDTFGVSDFIVRIYTGIKSLSDSLPLSDTVGKYFSRVRSDSFGNADSLLRNTGKIRSDAVAVVDSLTRLATSLKLFIDTFTLSDTVEALKGFILSFLDISGRSESMAKRSIKNFSDTSPLSEIMIKGAAFFKFFTEVIPISDIISKSLTSIRSFIEVTSFSDFVLRLYGKRVSDTLQPQSVLLFSSDFFKNLSDTAILVSSVVALKLRYLLYIDKFIISDISADGGNGAFATGYFGGMMFGGGFGNQGSLFTKFILKTTLDPVLIIDRIRRYINGFLKNCWTLIQKTGGSFSVIAKAAITFLQNSKPSSTFTNQPKSTSTFTNTSKTDSSWEKVEKRECE